MAIVLGPKLDLIVNANIGENYVDSFRQFLQAIDALLSASVINSSTVVPPPSPSNGDAYLLVGTPSGVWTGHQNAIAVWDTQVTNSGTNTTNPSWVFYTPNPGWLVWNVATSALLVFNGTAWNPVSTASVSSVFGRTGAVTAQTGDYTVSQVTGAVATVFGRTGPTITAQTGDYTVAQVTNAAHNGANSDITGLTGIPATTINSSGYSGPSVTVTGSVTAPVSVTTGTLSNVSGTLNITGTSGVLISGGLEVNSAIRIDSSTAVAVPTGDISLGTGTTSSATSGGATTLPATPAGYWIIAVGATLQKIPYYNV